MACYRFKLKNGTSGIICGKLGPHCASCQAVADIQCDYPVGRGKTCDRHLCEDCAYSVAPDVDYCRGHFIQWRQFRDAGGVERELANVVPFKLTPPDGRV